tara:strand:+ start:1323 stop:1643 length:321 start_codon:yes stop_codon:yes gene_type:complete
MVLSLSILSGVLLVLLAISIFINVRLGIIVLRIQDTIEETLDVLDDRYESITKILEIPLYSDSPEIKRIHRDIQACRDSVVLIANRLVSIDASKVDAALENEGKQE